MRAVAITGSYLNPSFEHARVLDAMRPRVLICEPQATMVTAAQRTASEHVHAIVVEPRTDPPVGVATTLDIAGILGWGRG